MTKKHTLFLSLFVLLAFLCGFFAALLLMQIGVLSPAVEPSETDPPETNPPRESTGASSTHPDTTEPVGSETLPPIHPGDITLPPREPGVYYVSDEAELRALDFADTPAGKNPKIVITEAFALSELLILDRPVDLYYATASASLQPKGAGILIRTRNEGTLTVASLSPAILQTGFLTIEAPFCHLNWEGSARPANEDVIRYCNLKSSYLEPTPSLGGAGELTVSQIAIRASKTGMPYAGSDIEVRGNVITLSYPLLVGQADLKSATVFVSGQGFAQQTVSLDLTATPTLTLTDDAGRDRSYRIEAERKAYSIPTVQIDTENLAPILTKTDYVKSTMLIDGQPISMKIRGRGNSSWSTFPKKSYRIKLDEGASLFGLPKNRDWVLVSSYTDKSLLRNTVAHALGAELGGLTFTPTHILVNLYINGEYLGVYTFAEKIEEGNGRVNFEPTEGEIAPTFPTDSGIADMGFLCEIGWDYDSENIYNKDYFDVKKVFRIYIKEPEITVKYQPELQFVKDYLLAAEQAIIRGEGYEELIDLDSFVDYFLLTELTNNTEGAFYRSCYLYKRAGGKLEMGPIWDFDMAFGNHFGDIPNYDGWCTTEFTYSMLSENWYSDLLRSDTFRSAVKARWNEVKDPLMSTALRTLTEGRAALYGSAEQNFLRWDILDEYVGLGSVNPTKYDTWEKQVDYVEAFVRSRWAYIDERIAREL